MSEQAPTKRLIVCIDGAEYDADGKLDNANTSTVCRLKTAIATSVCHDAQNRAFVQTVRYYQAASEGLSLANKFRSKSATTITSDQQIRYITKDICQTLDSADELFLYGFSRGAYIVRTVAGLLHHMGLPKLITEFDDVYKKALELQKARFEDDSFNGPKIVAYLKSRTIPPPAIQFVGVFDSIRAERHMHDFSFVSSIRHFRHAMAFNEVRLVHDPCDLPSEKSMQGRSFVQAWFMGANRDIGGGSQHDGLSLYPLQWMMLESMKAGLVFRSDPKVGSPMALAFPQYAGGLPRIGSDEAIEWQIHFANGIQISMYDLASLHGETTSDESHTIRISQNSSRYTTQRKVFSRGVIGWTDAGAFGTIIHPSMICLLDRNPRFYEQSHFKSRRNDLADFQEHCLRDNNAIWPWLEGMSLQASGVKAFRILVCGKTGVGKSTLINKVFGVEMTEESTSYSQGVHDINQAFESSSHPGLLVHDSRGWQAGSDQELDLIAKFLRHRAFQKDPADSLHVIWFCVDSDVSRIEEADKRTFETIAQFSHHVPVFVIGTKKDKLIAFHKMQLLEEKMKEIGDYMEANRLANLEADKLAEEQFLGLREQLSQIKHYKADGFCCISKDDDAGIKRLLSSTLELIVDDRVRLFCVAAQVVDVEQKIDSAITESMRLGIHAVRTAMVPLPFSGMIGTPTVSRILCEHVLQCFGFPKAAPEAVEDIMHRVVLKNLKAFMVVTLIQFTTIGAVTLGAAIPTLGIGTILGAAGSIIASPPTARMLFKCACDMILILERSFRYQGKYVSVKQIEDAAVYYTTTMTTSFAGKERLLQEHVHDEVDRLIPLKKVMVGFRFNSLRGGLEEIIYRNRFEKAPADPSATVEICDDPAIELDSREVPAELEASPRPAVRSELRGDSRLAELESPISPPSDTMGEGSLLTMMTSTTLTESLSPTEYGGGTNEWSESGTLPVRGWRKMSAKFSLKKKNSQK